MVGHPCWRSAQVGKCLELGTRFLISIKPPVKFYGPYLIHMQRGEGEGGTGWTHCGKFFNMYFSDTRVYFQSHTDKVIKENEYVQMNPKESVLLFLHLKMLNVKHLILLDSKPINL